MSCLIYDCYYCCYYYYYDCVASADCGAGATIYTEHAA